MVLIIGGIPVFQNRSSRSVELYGNESDACFIAQIQNIVGGPVLKVAH